MIKTIKIVLIAISLIFNFSITLRAQSISYNQQFQIFENAIYNTNTACLNDGGYIVCGRGPFGNYEIYAQIFNADHSRRGNEFRVNTNTYLEQDYPDVFCLSDTTIIITWTSWDGIYGQLLKYDGTKINPEFNIAPNGSVAQRMAKLNNGGFVICWVDEQWSDGSYVNDIYASIYDKNITKIGDSFLINTHVEDLQHKPKIAVLKSGEFIVSWISNNQDGIRTGVYYKIFSDAGDEVCDELRATPTANTYTPHYDLCALNDGGFVFIWPNGLNDYRYPDIIVQRFDSNFVKYDDIVQTRAATSTKGVGISSLENGGYVFFWELYNDLFGQFINEDNSKYRNEFKINTISNSTAYNNDPKAIQLKNNDIFFTWVQANLTYFKIYGKHFLEKLVHPILHYNLNYQLSHETITSTTQTLKLIKRQHSKN